MWDEAQEARSDLIDQVADLDDTLAEAILERESLDHITSTELEMALRRITLARVIIMQS